MVRIKFTEEFTDQPAIIRIVGVGGAGGNAVNRMIEAGLSHVEFIAANTDAQDLRRNLAPEKVHIGESLTKGLGVGGNPALGRQAAEETRERLSEVLNGADMIFITAGMGGGTGTGGAPVVAEIARSLENPPLIVGVVTRPFEFEGHVRSVQAESGIRELKSKVDTLVTISNDRLFDIIDSTTTSLEAYRVADDVLRQAVQAITDVITSGGMVNVDFADVRNIMAGAGEALMGMGEGEGSNRALDAARRAVGSPLLENLTIDGAKGVLINITGNRGVTMYEVREAMDFIRSAASPEAHVFFGQVFDDSLEDRVKVTVIATGFPPPRKIPLLRQKGRMRMGETSGYSGRFKQSAESRSNLFPASLAGINSTQNASSQEQDLKRPAYLRLKTRKIR